MSRYLLPALLLTTALASAPLTGRAASIEDGGHYIQEMLSQVISAQNIHIRNLNPQGFVILGQATTASNPSAYQAFYWPVGGTVVSLGALAPDATSEAIVISANGSVIAGDSLDTNGDWQAFRWTAASGMVGLGSLSPGNASHTKAMNADGAVVTGYSWGFSHGNYWIEGFRWTADGGMTGLGFIGPTQRCELDGGCSDYYNSLPQAISADGQVIVGRSSSSFGDEAFRWTEGTGMVGLGHLGGYESIANGVNANGSVVIGNSRNDLGNEEAFRWTQATGMTGLGFLNGDDQSGAYFVTADGSAVFGESWGSRGYELFRWTEGGMESLRDVLQNAGLNMDDWSFVIPFSGLSNTSVSADGNIVFGLGEYQGNFTGYLANLSTGGVTTPEALASSMQTIQQAGQQVAAVTRSYAPGGLFIAQNMQQIAVPALSLSGGRSDASSFANLSPASGGAAPSKLSAFLLGSVGLGHNNTSGNYQLNGTLGVTGQVSPDWNIGVGMIAGRTHSELDFNGDSRLDALGGMVLAAYTPYDSPLRIYGTAFAADLSLDNKRGYLNGGGLDYSRGESDGFAYGGALRVGYEKAIGTVDIPTSVMPYIEARYSKTKLDGYSETGGAFAASFGEQEDDYVASRIGLEFRQQVTEKLQLLYRPAWGHRISGDGDGFTATTAGLTQGYAGQAGDKDWAEFSVGGSYQASEKVTFTSELTGRTGTTSEPVAALTVGAFVKF